jgi:cytidyltransferase-related domain
MMLQALKKLCLRIIQKNGLDEKEFRKLNRSHQDFLEKKQNRYFLKPEYRKLLKVVLTGGAFDIIHPGHIYTLKEAKKKGDLLVVVVATDQTILKTKKRKPIYNQDIRLKNVQAIKYVDLALKGKKDWRKILNQVKPDIVVFGYDQEIKPIENVKIIKLKKFLDHPHAKTSKIKNLIGL